jgi:nucleoside-diphosphate-sugar epimerase
VSDSKALITGATGFIGSHLVEKLAAESWDLTFWVRPESDTSFLKRVPGKLVTGKLDDREALENAAAGQDYVFHLAARIHSAPTQVYQRANVLFTKNLVAACLEAAAHIKRFVYVSSIAAAGPSLAGIPKTEADPDNPQSEYGRTKRQGEQEVWQAEHALPITVIRPPNVYGPRQQQTELLIRLLEKRIYPSLRSTQATTSLIFVKDLIKGILQALRCENSIGETYYLCNEHGYAWRDLLEALKQEVLADSWYLPLPERLIELTAFGADMLKRTRLVRPFFGRGAWKAMVTTPWLFSPEKASLHFGFQSEYSLEAGMRETVAAYRKRKSLSKSPILL